MKKILTKSFIILYALSLILPNQTSFAYSESQSASLQNNQVNTALIEVVSYPQSAILNIVNPNSVSAAIAACGAMTNSSNFNLVQQPGLINLNEPASCFSLQINSSHLVQSKLSVQPLAISYEQAKVFVNSSRISTATFVPAPVSQNTPILPLLVLAIIEGVVISKKQTLNSKLLGFGHNIRQSLTLHQLQMLRC